MLTAWRIVRQRFVRQRGAAAAFDGEGARLTGGRWNSPGVPIVYTASTRALAILEMAVHINRAALLASYVLIPCRFDEHLVMTLDRDGLPPTWRRSPPPPEAAIVGDRWIDDARSVVLAVPSAILEEETNFLLNPRHPEFSRIAIGEPEPFEYDRRLIK